MTQKAPKILNEWDFSRGVKTNMDMQTYKQKLKENIEILINEGKHYEAYDIINDYEELVSDDPDIICMKSILYISEGHFEEAEDLLWSAIRKSNVTPDILYNLAYLYQMNGDNKKAYTFYQKVIECSDDINLITETKDIIDKINVNDTPYQCRFSIVIPTRNSADTLKYTLQTCLKQEFDNYEIVVSDNSSLNNDFTKKLIENFNDERIRYYTPPRELAMTENFEFAVSKATGEYIIVLGSDDALLFHALTTIDNVLNNIGARILRWPQVAYGWPNVKLKGYENFFGTPINESGNINYNEIDSKWLIQNVINFKTHYSALPMLYCNSVIHQGVLKKLINETGNVFKGNTPDVYSGFVLAYLQRKFFSIDVPMVIGGSSGNSNGIAFHNTPDKAKDIKNDFIKLNAKSGIKRQSIVPRIKSVDAAVVESFLNAKDALFPFDNDLSLDRKLFISKCIESLNTTDADFNEEFNSVQESVSDNKVLREWFENQYLNTPQTYDSGERKEYKYKRGFNNGFLRVDASSFNVNNVYDAAVLYRNLLGR